MVRREHISINLVMRHKKYKPQMFEDLKKIDKNILANAGYSRAREFHNMQGSVEKELHLKKGFLRFDISEHGILYTQTTCEHNIIDLLLAFFSQRFPQYYIVIALPDKTHMITPQHKTEIFENELHEVIKHLEKHLPKDYILGQLDIKEDIWETYYNSQFITQRRSPKLMQKMMPYKYRDKGMTETFVACESKRLTEYF